MDQVSVHLTQLPAISLLTDNTIYTLPLRDTRAASRPNGMVRSLPHKTKIFTCGNHDFSACTAKNFYETRGRELNSRYKVQDSPDDVEKSARILSASNLTRSNMTYLNNEACTFSVDRRETKHHVFKVWGSPWSPEFENWAWNYKPASEEAKQIHSGIPKDVDILITHTPPFELGGLDRIHNGTSVGCQELTRRLTLPDHEHDEAIRPKLHVFGHIHEARGVHLLEQKQAQQAALEAHETVLVNAALVEYDQDMWNTRRICKFSSPFLPFFFFSLLFLVFP